MAEQIRRLDYERRSKYKSLMKIGSGIQNIKKECSTQVRAANEMEDRKKELVLLKNQLHKRTFIERHTYEVKMMERFKNDLDVKSQRFNEEKFQLLRAKSAGPRIQEEKPVVMAMVPQKYYEHLSDDIDDDDMATWIRDDKRPLTQTAKSGHKQLPSSEESTNSSLNFTALSAVLKFKSRKRTKVNRDIKRSSSSLDTQQDRIAESLRFLHPDEFGRSKEDGTSTPIQFPSNRAGHTDHSPTSRTRSSMFRRQSAGPNILTAYIPRDVKSAPPGRRLSTKGHGNGNGGPNEQGSRSFRLLKDAFKKRRKEIPNPAKDMLKNVQTDHVKYATLLNERIKKRFNDIFEERIFESCITQIGLKRPSRPQTSR